MKILKILVGAWLVLVVGAVAIASTGSPSGNDPGPRTGHQVVSDVGQLDMLEADQAMLQRMQDAVIPNMVTMIETDPMWVDPEMIRLQEEHQAELHRMIAEPHEP